MKISTEEISYRFNKKLFLSVSPSLRLSVLILCLFLSLPATAFAPEKTAPATPADFPQRFCRQNHYDPAR